MSPMHAFVYLSSHLHLSVELYDGTPVFPVRQLPFLFLFHLDDQPAGSMRVDLLPLINESAREHPASVSP